MELNSIIAWINDGDSNTKFFQVSAINRKRTNCINFFKNDNGNWIDDPKRISDFTLGFSYKLFTTDNCSSNWNPSCPSSNYSPTFDLATLDRPISDQEIINDVFSFKPHKAPGPNGGTSCSIKSVTPSGP